MTNKGFNPYSPGFSIYLMVTTTLKNMSCCFNPYSPGFSIYLTNKWAEDLINLMLQSLFTWIFYLFYGILNVKGTLSKASILIHLDFLSILKNMEDKELFLYSFNPYSPGFSIYLKEKIREYCKSHELQSLFTWIFYLFKQIEIWFICWRQASILIHLDFLSI